MSQQLDARLQETGTRFLLYAQHKSLKGFEEPEVVYVNAAPGTIQAGPQDEDTYVIDAKDKQPYDERSGPPYPGEAHPPAQPDANGHFDHLKPGQREFTAAAMYATVRRTLDIWEDYFEQKIPWFFRMTYPRMELIPRVDWANAQAGMGFLEFGFGQKPDGSIDYDNPYAENFDVLAHETGHAIKNEIIRWPRSDATDTPEYHGHHEAFADLVAMVASLHFESMVDQLLENTKGNLFSTNELSRVGELSETRQIRIVFNDEKLSTVDQEEHSLSLPFSGGAFDVLVTIYQLNLLEKGLIPQELADDAAKARGRDVEEIQRRFERFYRNNEAWFKDALHDARDTFGRLMARAWKKTSRDNLRYWKVVRNMIDADRELYQGKYQHIIRDCFAWREITLPENISPRLTKRRVLIHEMNGSLVKEMH